jgi:hypothetical protein
MKTNTVTTQSHQLIDQPTSWPLLYLLPQTHYVRRHRAVNAHEYSPRPKAEVFGYVATSKKPSLLQRGINRLTAARNKAWLSLKQLGREIVHALVKWCVLPLTIATCLSIVAAMPAELQDGDYIVGYPA